MYNVEIFIDSKGRYCLLITVNNIPFAIEIKDYEYEFLKDKGVKNAN